MNTDRLIFFLLSLLFVLRANSGVRSGTSSIDRIICSKVPENATRTVYRNRLRVRYYGKSSNRKGTIHANDVEGLHRKAEIDVRLSFLSTSHIGSKTRERSILTQCCRMDHSHREALVGPSCTVASRIQRYPGAPEMKDALTNDTKVVDTLRRRHYGVKRFENWQKLREILLVRSKLIHNHNKAREKLRELSKNVSTLLNQGYNQSSEEINILKRSAEEEKQRAHELKLKAEGIDQQCADLLARMPNSVFADTPETSQVIRTDWCGKTSTSAAAPILDHLHLLETGGAALINPAMCGRGQNVLIGKIAETVNALISFAVRHFVGNGYLCVDVPLMLREAALQSTGHLTTFADYLYRLEKGVREENTYLIPTAEVALCNIYKDTTFGENELPLRLVAASPCFRNESVAHEGKKKTLLRRNMFRKIELFAITTAKQSCAELESLTRHAESIMKAFKLPYRTVLLSAMETGFASAKTYDIEVWFPSQKAFVEVASCSNCGNFQSRPLRIRHHAPGLSGTTQSMHHCHTLNATGLAVERILAAIIEHYQVRIDSKVRVEVPKPLAPYFQPETEFIL